MPVHLQIDYVSQYHTATKVVPNIARLRGPRLSIRTQELFYHQICDTSEYELQILKNILCVYY